MTTVIYCAGGNQSLMEIAQNAGMAYGIRQDYKPYSPPLMMDLHWEYYDWDQYVERVIEHAPLLAMVPDYTDPGQRESMQARAHQLRTLGVAVVMVCPKFVGAVADIPEWCRVAISVPSGYAGFLPPVRELAGRSVHLLGGAPQDQLRLARYYQHFGIVVESIDCNAHQVACWKGTYFDGRVWKNDGPGARNSFDAFRLSCENIVRKWREFG